MPDSETLHIAEIPYDSGELQYRYARYLCEDGSRWIRHGLFRAYWQNGNLKSEGHYEGKEEQPAEYRDGEEIEI